METCTHQHLKELALAYLRSVGCQAFALEVRCPISRYRVDAAGYCDRIPMAAADGPRRRCPPQTIIIECKQSRQDFFRDCGEIEALLALRAELDAIRRSIEEFQIKRDEPHLRLEGSSLFTDLESWDFASSRRASYRRVLRQLRRLDQRLHGETKFLLCARYRLANRLYIAAPVGLIRRHELPNGWGLLECAPDSLAPHQVEMRTVPALQMSVESPLHVVAERRQQRLLRNIAVAASSGAWRSRAMPLAAAL